MLPPGVNSYHVIFFTEDGRQLAKDMYIDSGEDIDEFCEVVVQAMLREAEEHGELMRRATVSQIGEPNDREVTIEEVHDAN